MKIGIMLRHYSQHGGGLQEYTKGLLPKLLALASSHEFVLMYQNSKLPGSYCNFKNVREISVNSQPKLVWDQVAVNRIASREKINLIFNPKYSLPLMAKCKTVFVCHGLDWYVMPQWSKLTDRMSHRFIVPKYYKKADAIIAVSDTAREHIIKFLKVSPDKIYLVYHGVDEVFKNPIPPELKRHIRSTYQLPDRYFLYVGQIYPPKNFGRILQAYAKVGPKSGIHLVIAGEHRWLCGRDLELIDTLNISPWVVRPGWIDHKDLPVFYAMAEALLLPSLYEACPAPPLEAMSIGCPVVTSNCYGAKEIADNAALLVDPKDVDSIAKGMEKILTDLPLRRQLVVNGHERVKNFTWEKCAQETLAVFEKLTCVILPFHMAFKVLLKFSIRWMGHLSYLHHIRLIY